MIYFPVMRRTRPCPEYQQESYRPILGHDLSQPQAAGYPSLADWPRPDHLLNIRQPSPYASTAYIRDHNYTYGPWNAFVQPISHEADHSYASRALLSTAHNLADISFNHHRAVDHQNIHIPCTTVPSFTNRLETNSHANLPRPITSVKRTKFRRSVTVPSLCTKKTVSDKVPGPEKCSDDKATMLQYYRDGNDKMSPGEPNSKKTRIKKSNSIGSLRSFNVVPRVQMGAKFQTGVVTAVEMKPTAGTRGSVRSGLEQLKHIGEQIAEAQSRRESIRVCVEQDIPLRDESDGTPPLVIDLPDELPTEDSPHPKPKTRVRPPTSSTLERSEYIEDGLDDGSIVEKNHSPSLRDDTDESPPLVIDLPGTEDSSRWRSRPTSGKAQDTSKSTLGAAKDVPSQAVFAKQTSIQLTGEQQTTEHPQAAPYWQTTARAQAAKYRQTTEYQQAPFIEKQHRDVIQRTTPVPPAYYSPIAATQSAHPVLTPSLTRPTPDSVASGKYKCIRCSVSFPNIQMLLRHRITCLAKECVTERLTCTQCNKTFTSTKTCSDHWKEYHSTERQHVCHMCGRRFTLARALEKHSWTHK